MKLAHPHTFFERLPARIVGGMMFACLAGCAANTGGGGTPAPPPPPVDRDAGIVGNPANNGPTNDYLFAVSYLSRSSGAEEVVNEVVNCSKTSTAQNVRLRIRPVHYAHTLNWAQVAASNQTHLYAEIQVDGACAILGLNANDVAYLAVAPSGTGTGVSVKVYRRALIGVEPTPVATATRISYCNYNPRHSYPGAHLEMPSECSDTSSHDTNPGTSQPAHNPTSSPALLSSGLWVSCSYGCCEAQF